MVTKRDTTTSGANSWSLRLIAVGLWLVIWQLVAQLVANPLILAGPLETLSTLLRLARTQRFWASVSFSVLRVFLGLVAAFVVGVALAFLSETSAFIKEFVRVLLVAIKSVPIVCFVVLLLIWFGSRNVSLIASFLVALPAFYFGCTEGLANINKGLAELMESLRVSRVRRTFGLVIPEIYPFVSAAAQTACGMAWKAGVAAELIGMPLNSMGERIYQTKLLLETGELFAWTLTVIACSWCFERLVLVVLHASVGLSYKLACRCKREARQESLLDSDTIPVASSTSVFPIHLTNLSCVYDSNTIFENIDLTLKVGDRLCFVDPSGAGKTSLLRTVEEALTHEQEVQTSMLFQDTRLIERLSARDNLALVAGQYCTREEIDALLLELLDPELLERPVSELSGGQRRRVEIARSFAIPAHVFLLDEPFASLDEELIEQVASFISKQLIGKCLILANHQPTAAVYLGAHQLTLDDIRTSA